MKINRTKNATRNIIFGIIIRVYQMAVPFLMRTAMIYLIGVQYVGLNSLFVSVLQVLNLAELGVGSAMVYSMYKPIAEDDAVMICALMRLYRIYYSVIGLFIAIVGGIITPFIPTLISGDIPNDIDVYVLYLLNLAATVFSYWFFAYKNSILLAHQRADILNKVLLITDTIKYILQLITLFVFGNYYCYVIVTLFAQILTNVITASAANKLYPAYKPIGVIGKEVRQKINKRIKDLFTSKIGSIIYDSADTIVISAFLGLTILTIYQNYFFIVTALTSFISIIFSAWTAGIGNSIIVETKEKNFQDFSTFTLIICWVAGFFSVCMLCIYQPFMQLWVGKKLMLSFLAVVCFVIYFFVRQLNALFNLYKDASGMWHEDRFRPLVAALVNLALNLLLVGVFGIYGILISTVMAIVLVGMPWLLHNLFTTIFDKKHMATYVKRLFMYIFIVVLSCACTYLICSFISFGLIATILFRGIICLIIPNGIFYIAYRKTNEFKRLLVVINNITKGRFHKLLEKM